MGKYMTYCAFNVLYLQARNHWDVVGKGEALYCSWKKKSIPAPEIGYLTRKDIARYKRADMKYYFAEGFFFFFLPFF